jgi:L-asparaginase II
MEAISVSVRRGEVVEARHRVHAVAFRDGAVVTAADDPSLVCFFRSSAKPIQALALVRARPDLDEAEIAIACASHQAEPVQVAAVRSLLAKAPADEEELECGEQEDRPPGRIHHNCSGKHAGFLAVCRARGWDSTGYRLRDHPLQRELLAQVAEAAGAREDGIPLAVDGCGVVTFGLTLEQMARAFATLPSLDGADRVLGAMRSRPELVGGQGALDTALMRALPGWAAKRGAEGLICAVSPDGIGIALKSEDGNPRPLGPALAEFVSRLGASPGDGLGVTLLTNSRHEVVGEVAVDAG